ncbi:MAG: DUF4157 domain-containing protein [Rhodothermales bacterium]|nr:DUF4157 domain-containing protein [Rhodothermales bacterium]
MTASSLRQPDPLTVSVMPARRSLQRKCACGGTPGPTGECAECRRKRLDLQRQASAPTREAEAPPLVHDVLRTTGQPLDAAMRADMEARLGFDFSNVRVHTDDRAADSASVVRARAYTVGDHVVFSHGAYAPGTQEGRHLLAHELVHVMQQADAGSPSALEIGAPASRHEREADRVADRVVSADRRPVPVHERGPATVARVGWKCMTEDLAYWSAAAAAVAACGGAIVTSETGIGLVLLGVACVAAVAAFIGAIVALRKCVESDPDADQREIERLRQEQERMERRLRQIEELVGEGESEEE